MTVVVDPDVKTTADIVLGTQMNVLAQSDLVKPAGERATVMTFDRPGEYEVGGVGLLGVKSGERLVFAIHIDGLNVVHLGKANAELTDKQMDEIGPIDILFVPADGDAVKVIKELNPAYAVPLGESGAIDEVIEKMKVEKNVVDKLTATKTDLPEETQVVILA